MAEPASAFLALIIAGFKTWQKIDHFVQSVKDAPRKLEQWQRLGVVLQSSADIIKTRIKDGRDNLTEPEKKLCKATEQFAEDFLKDLEELERKRPTTKAKGGSKYWLSLKTWLHEEEGLFTRLSRNAQIFQLSTSALSL
jgi:hypothetical protein